MKVQPVILAGGNGYRLWPLSQKTKPKQFIKNFANLSLFQNTVIRNSYLGTPLIMANINNQEIVIKQLKEINVYAKIIFEPDSKNTAICALAAAYYAKRQGYDTVVLIPSDHRIEDWLNYRDSLNIALKATKKYKFSVIGVSPTSSNTNFGYIRANQQINKYLYLGTQFIEKPNKELAKKLTALPEYFWNSGIYIFNIDYILKLTNQLIPVVSRKLSTIFNSNLNTKNIVKLNKEAYTSLPSVSFDHAISEKLKKIALIKANFKWNDLGTWESMWNLDKTTNKLSPVKGQGMVVTHNVKNSYINSDAKKTVAIDLKDILIIFKNGQLLVANKNSTEFIKPLVIDSN
ncbi:MAG: mannose-1-phosphate guanyltransferase [Alphaproteobacteria bacterium]|nr:mannose-1-phosphate guanyltransferase [Alphaproteobacteria bacterium]